MAVVVAALALIAVTVTATTRSYLIDQIDDRLAAAGGPERDDLGPHEPPPGGGDGERLGDLYEGVIGGDGELETIFPSNPSGQSCRRPPSIPRGLPTPRRRVTRSPREPSVAVTCATACASAPATTSSTSPRCRSPTSTTRSPG
jgi:hypothetical protein